MAINIIKQTNQGIVMEETPVTLSDEKLNGILLHTYEKAVSDSTKWHWYKLYSVLLSISGTLFLSLFTTTFNDVGQLKADVIMYIVIGITIITAIFGFICLGISVNQKKKNDTEMRDKSIKEITEKYCTNNK